MIRTLIRSFLPPVVLALVMALIYVLPGKKGLQDSAISPALPLAYDLPGWYGFKQQESQLERTMLAGDTKFSKAIYVRGRRSMFDKATPPATVSIVYSGSDMNASIHRPERCLPSQGHIDLRAQVEDIKLGNGRAIAFTRLVSRVPIHEKPGQFTEHINYYVFIGRDSIQTSHLDRTLRDMFDRSIKGVAQRWAYLQIGSFWGGETGFTQEEAEDILHSIIRELVPGQVDWAAIE